MERLGAGQYTTALMMKAFGDQPTFMQMFFPDVDIIAEMQDQFSRGYLA